MAAGSGRRKKGMRSLEVSLVRGTKGLEVLMCTVSGLPWDKLAIDAIRR